MFSSERALIAAVYTIYLFECLHWIRPEEIAATRKLLGGWHHWEVSDLSFTLLGRLPVLTNPLEFRAGFVRVIKRPDLTNVGRNLSDLWLNNLFSFGQLLPLYCAAGGLLFLVMLPAVVELGWLSMSWKPLLATVASFHTLIMIEFIRKGSSWRAEEPGLFWNSFASLCLNPLAALRAGDVLSENIFRLSGNDRGQ